MSMRWMTVIAATATIGLAAAANGGSQARPGADACTPQLDAGYVELVDEALRATEDVWGNRLLQAPRGPTYEQARRFLAPAVLGRAAGHVRLTASGYHYVPFSGEVGDRGAGTMAPHVADGSQIISQRSSGRSLSVSVGASGRERFGACRARLETPRLAGGYLPVLRTRYVDFQGTRYRQESFAARRGPARSLVSYVEITADTRGTGPARIRLTSSETGLRRGTNGLLRRDRSIALAASPGGKIDGSTITYLVPAGQMRTVYAAWPNTSLPTGTLQPGPAAHASARARLVRHWTRRLAEGAEIVVPEERVMDAFRALRIQDLALTWRYSIGNQYQEFSYPEGIDVAQVLAAQGYEDVAAAILVTSLGTPLTRYPNWKMAQKLVGFGLHYRLYRDRSLLERATPSLRAYVAALGRQIRTTPNGMLQRERFSSDIADEVYGLHTQAVAWQGLLSLALAWEEAGHAPEAAEARRLATRLEAGLRNAVRASQRRLPDGSLFVPARLLDHEQPYRTVTESRSGAYWNLVAPYAFGSGLFAAGSPEAEGVIRYLLLHGSRLLGLVRAGAYSLYGLDPQPPESGVNPVYGLNVARFLADNDRPDQLVLSLYGQLAAGMAPGTFVSGEGISVAPLGREYLRSMYLPPNGASNASFLETLRLMLVHETRDRELRSRGLELAFATPRSWLGARKRIVVRDAPTSFGPVSFSITSSTNTVRATVDLPARSRPRTATLRLRLPEGRRIAAVRLNGRPSRRFDRRAETIGLPTQPGRLEIVVGVVTG